MKLNKLTNKKLKINHSDQCLWFWLGLRLDLLSFVIYTTVIFLMGLCIYNDKYEMITFLSLSLTTALNINSPLSNFLPWLGVCEDKFRAVERIRKTTDAIEDERDNDKQIQSNKMDEKIDFKLAVEFKNVFLKYDKNGEDILKDISFNIIKGKKIAIIGRYV
jgi:ABC-type multidrug transport system fused ATPase/permease subunit